MACPKCQKYNGYVPVNEMDLVRHPQNVTFMPCQECFNGCAHEDGFWRLEKYHGKDNGKFSCMSGCGYIIDSLPEGQEEVDIGGDRNGRIINSPIRDFNID